MERTQAQVDALWEDMTTYHIVGHVVLPRNTLITNIPVLVTTLQQLYEGTHAAVGAFRVVRCAGQEMRCPVYEVVFIRDVHDDREALNDKLLAGKNFDQTLRKQLQKELDAAIDGCSLQMSVVLS